uniref:F5/8 type C domain-containing protein n=1 Tax=Panagrellus redivivus TaxID=6233 RepID=A0A7E4WAZ6_PANRE
MRDWLIIDHSKYDCFGQQVLYFEERVVRFIRIQCNNYYRCVIDANIEALYSTDSFEIDSDTSLLVPKDNLIPTTISNAVDGWVNGEIIDGHIIHGFDECIIYQFPQPYIIGSLKLQLNEKCSYSIKISTDKNTWERVFAEKNVSGWRIATFEKRPVMFINIKGVKKPFVDFKLSKLECPAN